MIIHEKGKNNINTTVIKAKTGELRSDENSDILQLILQDGHYYNDVASKNNKNKLKFTFRTGQF